jgi:hypothetical protein
MKTPGGVEVYPHEFLTLKVSGHLYVPAALPMGKTTRGTVENGVRCSSEPVWTLWKEKKGSAVSDRGTTEAGEWNFPY